MDLSRIAQRILSKNFKSAGRIDVLQAIDATFSNLGVYPPVMKETDPDTYEGEIDTGWVLTVKELPNNEMEIILNGQPVDSIEKAVNNYKNKKSTVSPIEVAIWDEVGSDWSTKKIPLNPGTPKEQLSQIEDFMESEARKWTGPSIPMEPWTVMSIKPMTLSGQPIDPSESETSFSPVLGDVWVAKHQSGRGHLGLTVWPR